MRKLALAMMAVAAVVGAALAADEPGPYDRRLAEAAAQIVAGRMGSLRGGFAMDEEPDLPAPAAAPAAPARTLPPPGVWRNGLAVAVERKSSVSPEL